MSRVVYHAQHEYLSVKIFTAKALAYVPTIDEARRALASEVPSASLRYIANAEGLFVSVTVPPAMSTSMVERSRVGKEVELARELIREKIQEFEPDYVGGTMTREEKVKGTNLCPRCGNHRLYTEEERRAKHCGECSRQLSFMVPGRHPVFSRVPSADEQLAAGVHPANIEHYQPRRRP